MRLPVNEMSQPFLRQLYETTDSNALAAMYITENKALISASENISQQTAHTVCVAYRAHSIHPTRLSLVKN